MPSYRIIRLFLFVFFWFNLVSSQNFPVKTYTAANELPNSTVRSLLVDSNNILWIGTDNGVVKKENDVFKSFFEEDGLALNNCWAITEDENKNIWFGSYGAGVSIYDGTKFKVISTKEGLVHDEITSFFSHGNNMYVGTSNGFSIMDINTLQVLSFNPPTGNDLFRITDFFEYGNEIYLVSYNTGIFKIQEKNGQKHIVKVNDHKNIYSILVDNDSIYSSNKGFFTKHKLLEYVKESNSISSEELGTSIIWDHLKTRDNKLFVAAWGIYDTNGGIYEIKNDRLIPRASEFNVPSKEVLSLAYDETFEKLYVGTKDAGLTEIALNPQIKFNPIKEERIIGFAEAENTSALLMNDGLLVQENGKEFRINLVQLKEWQENYVSTTKIPLPKHEDDFYELDYTTKAEEIIFYDIKSNRDKYWLNTNIGLFAIKARGELDRYIPLHTEEINFTETGNLIETNPYGGVRVYSDLDTFTYKHFKKENVNTPTMIVSSFQRGSKTYFLSVFSGFYKWENGEFKSYLKNAIWEEKKLRHITPLGNNLAISNEFGDVFIINDDASFKVLQKIPRAKIPGNTIAFLKQHDENLLIGTEKGLTLFKDNNYIFLDKEQGLEQPLLSAEVKNKSIAIGSDNGYYLINLVAITDTKALVDQLKLNEIYINNDEYALEPSVDFKELNLAHDENTILLQFTTNAHPFPNKLKYQYRLNDNENWSLPSSKPEIFLAFLSPDTYDVAIKVSDESTGLNFTQSLISLTIVPPFWKTWWFLLLMLASLLIIVFLIYKYQIKQTKEFEAQKRKIQKRFEETKMEALLAQMNPHFIFNAMNSIQNYIMDSDIDNASIFLGDFAKLIRLNLDHCTKPKILLVEEIEYLQAYIRLENTRFNNRIEVVIEVDPSIDTYEVEVPTMLLQTFVENVFVHAFPPSVADPTLKISFELFSENILICKIEDNGIGFSNDATKKLHESKGLSLVKERMTFLGYDIEKAVQIISKRDKGTTVILSLEV